MTPSNPGNSGLALCSQSHWSASNQNSSKDFLQKKHNLHILSLGHRHS